ncbi:MAG: hypothetical protein NT080_07605 [Spirochaetes bacterium]|nr:hypothetical protein [Spirochaetota bacterium]
MLRAPINGLLSRRIAESIDATLRVRIRAGVSMRWSGEAGNAGLEVAGEIGSPAR